MNITYLLTQYYNGMELHGEGRKKKKQLPVSDDDEKEKEDAENHKACRVSNVFSIFRHKNGQNLDIYLTLILRHKNHYYHVGQISISATQVKHT